MTTPPTAPVDEDAFLKAWAKWPSTKLTVSAAYEFVEHYEAAKAKPVALTENEAVEIMASAWFKHGGKSLEQQMRKIWRTLVQEGYAKATSVVDVERVADEIMEHIPSSPVFNPKDPTGYQWARAIATSCAKAVIAAITQPGDEIHINPKQRNPIRISIPAGYKVKSTAENSVMLEWVGIGQPDEGEGVE